MNVQENKNKIRRFIKEKNRIESPLGVIEVYEGIGEGGNALVYNARFGKNEVALKLLAEEEGSSKYKRFLIEFREIVQLADTGAVVPIFYFGLLEIDEKQFPYMLMKKYPFTLESWSASNPVANFDSLKVILKNLLDIISVIHKKNIVHRDLKPENILVSEKGGMILADFGISWFDPEFYERFVHTGKKDKMANFDFSAPEQFKKGSKPHATMDIFALGQIITWLITGGVARGSRIPLSSVDKSFATIEPVVGKMLSREPAERPQSIDSIRDMIHVAIQRHNEEASLQIEINRVIGEMRRFNDVLLFCFPGKRGLIETDNPKKVDTVMSEINKLVEETDLWWTQGSSNCSISNEIRKINDDTWIMDGTEIKIEKIWALKDSYSLDHQFFVIKTIPLPPFGLYEEVEGVRWEEAAWFKDRYISRHEYDDGVAVIDGESVWIEGEAEIRSRNLYSDYYFIATQSHPVLLSENDEVVMEVYEKLLETGYLDEEDVKKLTRLRRHRISIMMN